MSSDTVMFTSVSGPRPGVTRIRVRGILDQQTVQSLRLALAQASAGNLRRLEVVLDDEHFFAEQGLIDLADAQGYLGPRIVLIYAGRNIGILMRTLGIE